MKNYFGFVRDHSASMFHIREAARNDYNQNISAIRDESKKQNQDSIISTMSCGIGRPAKNVWDVRNSSVSQLNSITNYIADGTSTPLFDAVKEVIEELKRVPDADADDVAFLVFVTTDGEDNASYTRDSDLGKMILQLQNTDKWTFVFRVPRGYSSYLVKRLGIHPGNVQEWDQSKKGVEESTIATQSSFTNYFTQRSAGLKSTRTFYTDMSDISRKDLKTNLEDISSKVKILTVPASKDGSQIRDFIEEETGSFTKGHAFYQLTKREKAVQDYKLIAVRDKKTRAVYGGTAARQLLGMPTDRSISVAPGDHANYELFIQSTSVNRKLVKGTKVLVWDGNNV